MRYIKLILFLFFLVNIKLLAQLNNVVYNQEKCGLNFFHKSLKVTSRMATPPGNPTPVKIDISELTTCKKVEKAFVWWGVSYRSNSPTNPRLTIVKPNQQSVVLNSTIAGQAGSKCWDEVGTRNFRVDVTSVITENGTYSFDVDNDDWEVDGITLLVIYRDLQANYLGRMHIEDGLFTTNRGATYSHTKSNQTFCANSTFGQAFIIASDLQQGANPPDGLVRFEFNGTPTDRLATFWNFETFNTSVTQNQTSYTYTVSTLTDCFSVLVAGLYTQTTTCRSCPDQININASSNKSGVCPGDPVTLNAEGAATYQWSSIPAGFSSTQKSPTVNPTSTTRYVVRGTTADGCQFGFDTVLVTVFPQPVISMVNTVEICRGESIQLSPSISSGKPPYKFQWSPATNLSATNIQNPIANPSSTTEYTLTVTDDNGCSNTASIRVVVNPLPTIDIGNQVEICFGDTISIGNTAQNGTPPYNYNWTPALGLINNNTPVVKVTPKTTTTYYCNVTDSKGCKAIDSITVIVNPLPEPVITPLGPTTFCSCDSLILDAGGPYVDYLWSTGETTRRITVRQTGNYTVMVTDDKGCKNTSPPLAVTVIHPNSTIAMPETVLRAKPGENISIPIYIKASNDLDFCKVFNFTTVISYNKSLLVPKGNTPQGTIVGNSRVITINGTRKANDSILFTMQFLATLGNAEQTEINFDKFDWTDCAAGVSLLDSVFALDGLCREGGIARLFTEGTPNLKVLLFPNPANDNINLLAEIPYKTNVKINIINTLGNVVHTLNESISTSGTISRNLDLSELNSGVYILVLTTDYETLTTILEVVK